MVVVAILNPRIDPDELAGKYIVLDLLARDAKGHLYNVEMRCEPPRVSRRLQPLRGWSHEEINQVFP